ncbi:hypothetical protein [Bradyrhizobium sp. CCGB01]|uniref:hypothetical protein n=1 Tax=Bradyrhizobium sp. CCGB01 TaxID=2949634 RepID=UPI0020B45A7D|nr:hypothetical protein [Bradyrhizobium sp. CCGB01]MCP3411511.1 hypothetical protein [Bradyrhizobium sp. CCGB01]
MPAFRFKQSLAAASLSLALALGLAVLVQPGAGFAYTQEEQQACTPDAMRLCGEFVPNVDAITACMIQKKSQLSPQCRAFFRSGPERGEVRAGKPTSIKSSPAKSAKKSTKPAPKTARKKNSSEG